jgi:eukaryotic-like serine/threonine-protein kinase
VPTQSRARLLDSLAPAEDATHTMTLTGKHEIVGTLYYMSPEQLQGQASGREIDARTDIFSFGLVLYEMLTGKRAFDGATQVSVIAAIMERPAPSIVDVAPLALDRLLKKCLEKDPDNRWQTARDLKDELEWIAQGSTTESPPSRATKLPWIVAAVMTLVAVFGWMLFELRTSRPEAAAPSEVSFTIPPPSGKELAHLGQMSADSLSPDGSMILFRGSDGFYVRQLSSPESEILTPWHWFGNPFWASEPATTAFPTDHGRLMKMRVPKGAQEMITNTGDLWGGSWGRKESVSLLNRIPVYSASPQRAESSFR